MNGYFELTLWLHKYEMDVLSSALESQGTSVEKRMQEMLIDLYADTVPCAVQQEIRARIDAEYAAARAAEEAAQKYTAFCVREDGVKSFFQLDEAKELLEVAKFLRRYLRGDRGRGSAALRQSAFAGMEPVTAGRYEQLLALRMTAPWKVTGVFELDFDKQEVSTADAVTGWRTYSMRDVSAAVYHAYRESNLGPERYMALFLDGLEGKEIIHAEEITPLVGPVL